MRLYDGCPDADLQSMIDKERELQENIQKLGYRAVYFPAEEQYGLFKVDNHCSFFPLLDSLEDCLIRAKEKVDADNQNIETAIQHINAIAGIR